jgi:hypothetical protein
LISTSSAGGGELSLVVFLACASLLANLTLAYLNGGRRRK